MINIKYAILLFTILLNFVIKAQLKITVKDKYGNPIPEVTVYSDKPYFKSETDQNGIIEIPAIEFEQIVFYKLDFKTQKISSKDFKNNAFLITLNPSVLEIGEMVVSATKWNQSSSELSSKITTIKAKDIALQNPQTAADLLANSGEVFIQKSQQGGGSPMIRGFATNRLLYVVDGVRMNSAIFRAGNIQNIISIDALAIESAEVLFGPGSVIYGSDAIGGVMNFRTLNPKFSKTGKPLTKANALMRYSSANNEKTGHFDVMVGWKKWAILTSVSANDFSDLRMGSHGPDEYLRTFYVQRQDSIDRVVMNSNPLIQNPTAYSQVNLMQKVSYTPNKNWQIDYGFHYSESSEYARYDRLIELTSSGLPRSAVWNYGPQKWMMNNLTINHHKENKIYNEMSIRLAQQYFEESRIDRNFSGGNKNRLRTQLEKVDAYSINVDFEKAIKNHKLYYGIEGVFNKVGSFGTAINIATGDSIPVADRYPASTWLSYGAYFTYQANISKLISFQAGVRYNQFQLQSDFTRILEFYPFDFSEAKLNKGATTGSAGIVIRPSEKLKISLVGSTGFRAPNVDDIGKIFDFGPNEVVVPNKDLSAEYAYNGELSISKIFGEWLKLDATGYYTYLDNSMVRRAFQVNGADSILFDDVQSKVYAIQNAAFATVFGFHAGFELRLPSGFSLLSQYNFQNGVEEMNDGNDSRSRHAAPAFGVTRLTYTNEKVTLQLYAMYSAGLNFDELNEEEKLKPAIYAIDENGNPYSPAWYTLNLKTIFKLTDNFSVSAGLENILDKRYKTYSSGLVAPSRNFVLSLKGSF
jgi:hemoglobin/transferrin/lactoferrin receptor protein